MVVIKNNIFTTILDLGNQLFKKCLTIDTLMINNYLFIYEYKGRKVQVRYIKNNIMIMNKT